MQEIDVELPVIYGENKRAYQCREPEVMLAGPADTGKTIAQLTKLHWLACRHKNASLVIARKQLTDTYATVLVTFQKKILGEDTFIKPYGGEKPQWFDYPNGSRIWIAGLDKAGKVLSAEHDVIYVNQAEELGLPDWETLTTRTTGRAGHMPYSQTIADCNPAGPTHWIKTRSRAGALTMFESRHQDNPELFDQTTGQITERGIQRIGRLKTLTGARLMRLYHGLWVSPEGAIYSVFDEAKHQIQAFPIPPLWPRVVGIDPLGAYTAAVWAAFDQETKMLHIYREYYQPFGVTTAGHAKAILELSKGETIFIWVGGGPSERQQRVDFAGAGIPLLAPPISDVWSGIDRVNRLLSDFSMVIHDSCPQLLSEITDYRRKLKDGEPTDAIENKEEFHLCLAGGTLVTTTREGQVPIEQVRVGDLVLTRNGHKRVLASALTQQSARVMTAHLSNGVTLTGTPGHPVYVRNKGYTDLQALRYYDIMETSNGWEVSLCSQQGKKLSTMGVSGIGILTRTIERIGSIIAMVSVWRPMNTCIGTSGRSITGQFQRAMQCIMGMVTQAITPSKTLSASRSLSTQNGIGTISPKSYWNNEGNTLTESENLHLSGIVHQRAGNGTVFTAKRHGKIGSQLHLPANIVTKSSIRSPGMDIPSIAPITASQQQDGHLALTMKREHVLDAASYLRPTSIPIGNTVPVYVVRVTEAPRQPVYNLTVEGGEFFANDILTHNCDSLRYLVAYLLGPQEQTEVHYRPVQIGPQW